MRTHILSTTPFRPLWQTIAGVILALVCVAGMVLQSAQPAWADCTITEGDIRQDIDAYLRKHIPTNDGETLNLDMIHIPGAPFVFEGLDTRENIRVNLHADLNTQFSNRTIVRVTLTDSTGTQRKEVGVPVRIQLLKPVWVVKHHIPAGQRLSKKDLTLEVRDISQSYYNVADESFVPSNYAARVSIRPGIMLDKRSIIRPPAVENRQDVKVIMTNGNGMNVSFFGIALEPGQIGETIRVRNKLKQNKYYNARVIKDGVVMVKL